MRKGISLSIGNLILSFFILTILFVISFYFTSSRLSSNTIPTGELTKTGTSPYSSQLTVRRAEIEQILRSSLADAIKEVEANGGYLIGENVTYPNQNLYPNKTADFKGKRIPYYRVCGETRYPTLDEIRERIHKRFHELAYYRLSRYASSNDETEFKGLNFTLNILDGKVTLGGKVYAYYKGEPIPGDYYVSVPTKLKEIYEYATSFVGFTKDTRLLDYLFIYLLYKAKENYFPTRDIMTKCGERIHLDNLELSQHFMNLYYYFLSNVNMNVPLNESHNYFLEDDDPLFFAFSDIIKGKTKLWYDNKLKEVELFAPDDYFVIFPHGIDIINNEPVLKVVVPIADKCEKSYDLKYDFPFAYIVGLKDDALSDDAYFYFAEYSFIKNMAPANCSYDDLPDNTHILVPGFEDSNKYAKDILANSNTESEKDRCNDKKITIQVVDDSGNPIPNAGVVYGNCTLGRTDAYGRVSGGVENGRKLLIISPPKGYAGYAKMEDVEEYKHIVLPKLNNITNINTKGVEVDVGLVNLNNYPPTPCEECGDTVGYEYNYPYVDISASNSVLGPTNAIMEIRKCVIHDSLPDNINSNIVFSTSPLPYSVDSSKKDNILYPGITYSSNLELDKGILEYPSRSAYLYITENKEDVNGGEKLVGSFIYNTKKYPIKDTPQVTPQGLKYVNVPYIKVVSSDYSSFSTYLLDGNYLDIVRLGVAKYTDKDSLDKISSELSEDIFWMCGINPFENPQYKKYYPIKSTCDAAIKAAKDCGVKDISNYCRKELKEGANPECSNSYVCKCDFNALRQAMHKLGCELVIRG